MQSISQFLDQDVVVVLRDNKKLIGKMRSFDQFANLVLEGAFERIYVGRVFGDIPLGVYMVRGENVVLMGELDGSQEDRGGLARVSPHEIMRLQRENEAREAQIQAEKRRALIARGFVVDVGGVDDMNFY